MFEKNIDKNTLLFSYHKTLQYKPFLWVMIVSTLIGIPVFHLLLSQWNDTIAWVVTGFSFYTIVWLIYDCRVIKNSPIALTPTILSIKLGSRWKTKIPLALIEKLHTSLTYEEAKVYQNLVILNEKNIYLELLHPIEIKGMFGMNKKRDKIALYLDEPNDFVKQLKEFKDGL
jgi:hypothetical protein